MSASTTPTTVPTTSGPLVEARWLEDRLDDPDLVIVDATVVLDPDTWEANSGRRTYDAAHIPGAVFMDLIAELSDPTADEDLPDGVHAYQLPSPEELGEALRRYGITNDTTVVAYDTTAGMWAARLWWMLRLIGHDRVAVLDGGWQRWVDEGRPTSDGQPEVSPADAPFEVRLRPELLATKDEVAASLERDDTVLVNALWPAQFRGEAETPLPRPGRIPGSVNVPFTDTVGEDGRVRSAEELRERFAAAGVDGQRRVVTYCGGGIAASSDALALATIGIHAAVYDGSLAEWVLDPELPVETG